MTWFYYSRYLAVGIRFEVSKPKLPCNNIFGGLHINCYFGYAKLTNVALDKFIAEYYAQRLYVGCRTLH